VDPPPAFASEKGPCAPVREGERSAKKRKKEKEKRKKNHKKKLEKGSSVEREV
jgi:hypothetical protein